MRSALESRANQTRDITIDAVVLNLYIILRTFYTTAASAASAAASMAVAVAIAVYVPVPVTANTSRANRFIQYLLQFLIINIL